MRIKVLLIILVLLALGGGMAVRELQNNEKPKQTQSDPGLLTRCLADAKEDYDRNMDEANAAPAPNFEEIAKTTFETDKSICHQVYDK